MTSAGLMTRRTRQLLRRSLPPVRDVADLLRADEELKQLPETQRRLFMCEYVRIIAPHIDHVRRDFEALPPDAQAAMRERHDRIMRNWGTLLADVERQ